jgi:hypothetical protein
VQETHALQETRGHLTQSKLTVQSKKHFNAVRVDCAVQETFNAVQVQCAVQETRVHFQTAAAQPETPHGSRVSSRILQLVIGTPNPRSSVGQTKGWEKALANLIT